MTTSVHTNETFYTPFYFNEVNQYASVVVVDGKPSLYDPFHDASHSGKTISDIVRATNEKYPFACAMTQEQFYESDSFIVHRAGFCPVGMIDKTYEQEDAMGLIVSTYKLEWDESMNTFIAIKSKEYDAVAVWSISRRTWKVVFVGNDSDISWSSPSGDIDTAISECVNKIMKGGNNE